MKKIYLLTSLVAISAGSLLAQVNRTIPSNKGLSKSISKRTEAVSFASQRNSGGVNTPTAIAGSLTSTNNYVPGTTMDLTFDLELTNTDQEYGDMLAITFPAGFTIISTTNTPNLGPDDGQAGSDGPEAYNGIVGQMISWGNNDNNYGGIVSGGGVIYPITIRVQVGAISGDQSITFTVSGDGFTNAGAAADLVAATSIVKEQASVDASVQQVGVNYTGCTLGNEPILALIANNGSTAISNFDVNYTVNGGVAVTESYTGSIASGASAVYQFTTLANLSAPGTYDLAVYTTLAGDGDLSNDTSYTSTESITTSNLSLAPYTTSFETGQLTGLSLDDVNNDGESWGLVASGAHSGTNAIRMFPASTLSDDWFFTPCAKMEVGKYYYLKYWRRMTTNYCGSLEVKMGQGNASTDMTKSLKPLTALTANSIYAKDSIFITVAANGSYNVGFRAFRDAGITCTNGNIALRIDDITIAETFVWYADADGDTFGNQLDSLIANTQPTGYVANNKDCNDADANVNPNTVWYADVDGDGFGNNSNITHACLMPTGYVADNTDCNDNDANINPTTIWYQDFDGDGYGNASATQAGCVAPIGYVANNTDCDDLNALINPATVWFEDADGDGYGNNSSTLVSCSQPTGYVSDNTDCDDTDAGINPTTVWYLDNDGDGFGDNATTQVACIAPLGYVLDNNDCDDNNVNVNPDVVWFEDFDSDGLGDPNSTLQGCTQPTGFVANSNDCDDSNSSILGGLTYYMDFDGDTYGDPSTSIVSCSLPLGYVLNNTDCDDADANINPATIWYADIDGDGYGDATATLSACIAPANYVADATDCNDNSAGINPTTVWFEDSDGDTFGNPLSTLVQCTQPIGFVSNANDCDDSDNLIGLATAVWYADTDGDGFGDATDSQIACAAPNGYVADNTDCDDTDASINPTTIWYADTDGDGFGDAATILIACVQPLNYVLNSNDCNDNDNLLHAPTAWYMDMDNDGFGDNSIMLMACVQPANYVADNTDCDDNNSAFGPLSAGTIQLGSNTICQGDFASAQLIGSSGSTYSWYVSTNGNTPNLLATGITAISGNPGQAGTVDVVCVVGGGSCSAVTTAAVTITVNPLLAWYADADADGYGDINTSVMDCNQPTGFVTNNTDCDDNDANAYQSASLYIDMDGDGYDAGSSTMCFGASLPTGYSLTTFGSDCDDADINAYQSASLYADMDGDGYDAGSSTMCYGATVPVGYSLVTLGSDCDDADINAYQSASLYADMDGDGYDAGSSTMCYGATVPTGYSLVTSGSDCDDADVNAYQSASLYVDMDNDGYDNGSSTMCYGATVPTGYSLTTLGSDCNDNDNTVYPFSQSAGFDVMNMDPMVMFAAQDSLGGSTFSWNFGDGNTATGVYTSNTYLADGNYTVTLTATACGSDVVSTTTFTISLTGLKTAAKVVNTIVTYPNPAKEQLTIAAKGISTATISLVAMNGKVIANDKVNFVNGNYTINTSNVAEGIYFLNVSNDTVNKTIKVSVVK